MEQNYKRSFKTNRRSASLFVHNVGLQRCCANYRWGPGVRDHFLIHHVVAGRGAYSAGGVTYPVEAGETFLAYPDISITYCADAEHPWEYLWVGFSGNDARLLLSQTDFTPETPVIRTGNGERMRKLLLQIYASRGNRPHEAAGMTGRLYLFLAFLMEQSVRLHAQETTAALATRAAEFMNESFAHAVTVEDVARFVGVSRSWLYRSFIKQFSVSPSRYLTELRLSRAALLLQQNQTNVAETSCSVGYLDPEYFSRAFHARYGCPPREYARQFRENQP
jgi:AraC-like DNA-binding protein